jgi:hypothetical protein
MHVFPEFLNYCFCLKIVLHAHFVELMVLIEYIKLRMGTRYMEDAQRTYIHEEEVKGCMLVWVMQELSQMGIEKEK